LGLVVVLVLGLVPVLVVPGLVQHKLP